jgi:hypothetical protein
MQGGCYCGALRYEIIADPVMKAQCHCRECQYITGGGPNFFMAIPDDSFTITKGTVATFTRSDLENPRTRQFCGTCGTHITTLLPGRPLVIVKVGTLDDPAKNYGEPQLAIFMKDSQPYHVVAPDLPCFQDRAPPPK